MESKIQSQVQFPLGSTSSTKRTLLNTHLEPSPQISQIHGRKKHPHQPKKIWDPLEANMMTFEKNRNKAANLSERIQKVKHDRFYKLPSESKPTLPYLIDKKQIPHLNLDNPRPAPFPYLKRPTPPPFPLPTFEASNESFDTHEASDEIPKIPSIIHNLSQEPRIDAAKLDAERKYRPLLGPRVAKTKLNVSKSPKYLKSKPPKQLAQEAVEWERHLRESPPNDITSERLSSFFPGRKIPSKSRAKKLFDPTESSTPLDTTLRLIAARIRDTESQESLVNPPSELLVETINETDEDGIRHSKLRDITYDARAYFQMVPRARARVIPNRTIKIAEAEMNHIQKLTSSALNVARPKRFDLFKKTKFYVNNGLPTLVEHHQGNNFAPLETLNIPYKNQKPNSQDPKKFVVDMVGFKDKEISFHVDGHIISVTGNRAQDLTNHHRGVVETVVLPPYLNLNKIRFVRDYGGRVILEELKDI